MADVISRLRLDSGEFDSKIKRAGQELMAYSEHCKKMGLEMGYANKDAKEFAKALGSMQTTSSSARGKINELTEAFVNLKVMYKNMTDEEKNNTFGKNLAASLDQLKTRIDEAKQNLNSVNAELGNTKQAEDGAKSGLEGLTSALGINVKSLAGWGAALTAGKIALDVAKDAFFASEATVDEWGRVVDSSKSLYEGFLTALNTGDISGYLSRIDEIVNAARTAYNELDRLGTMKTIQAPKISAQQTENERIRSMIQTGRYIAPVDGRRNAVFNGREMQNGDKLTAGQIRALEKQLQNGMQNVVKLVSNEVKQTGKAIDAVYERQAKELGISLKEFRKGTSSMEEFDKRMAGYDKYQQWREQHTTIDQQSGREIVARGNPYAEYGKWGTFRVDGDRYNQLVQLIQQRDQQAGQAYSMQSQAYRTMNRAEGFTVSKLMGNGGTGNKNEKEYDDLQKVQQEIAKLTKEAYTADRKRVEEIQAEIAGLQEEERRLISIRDLVTNKNNDPLKAIEAQFPDMSAQNYNTGYAGSTQARQDGLKSDYGMSLENFGKAPISTQSIQTFITETKSLLQQADFGSDLWTKMTEQFSDTSVMSTLLQEFAKAGVEGADLQSIAADLKTHLLDGDIPDEIIQGYVDQLNTMLKAKFDETEWPEVLVKFNADTKSIEKMSKQQQKDAQGMAKEWQVVGNSISAVGSAMNSIKDPTAKIVGIVMSGIASTAQGAGQAISKASSTTTSWYEYLAAAAAITAQMITTISQIHDVTGYASGGIVGGNSYSGDNLRMPVDGGGMIGVNSGELILNRSQQDSLAAQLRGSGTDGLQLSAEISGEDIIMVLDRRSVRRGKGEYVTTGRRY